MRILILNTDYPPFLRWLYRRHPGLEDRSWSAQMRARNESLFGVADFYSSNLRALGHDAWEIHANNPWMQRAWAVEHGAHSGREPGGWGRRVKASVSRWWPGAGRRARAPRALEIDGEVLRAQVRHYRPDVLLNHDMAAIHPELVGELRAGVPLVVGQIASPIPEGRQWGGYDLVISSLPNVVAYFDARGVPAELHRLGFEPRVLDVLGPQNRDIPVSFVGSLSRSHGERMRWLEHVCQRLEVVVWGLGLEGVAPDSAIRRRYRGQAWGTDMYRILQRSCISLNHHIDMANGYANNMRLFEVTGVGTLLVTDWKANLSEMFEAGVEVVTYRTPEECVEVLRYYLEHDEERVRIARAGQERTLREHTYLGRMGELAQLLEAHLAKRGRAAVAAGSREELLRTPERPAQKGGACDSGL